MQHAPIASNPDPDVLTVHTSKLDFLVSLNFITVNKNVVTTRSGRTVKLPRKFSLN